MSCCGLRCPARQKFKHLVGLLATLGLALSRKFFARPGEQYGLSVAGKGNIAEQAAWATLPNRPLGLNKTLTLISIASAKKRLQENQNF
jgi:hypothetical protein